MKFKNSAIILTIICIVITGLGFVLIGGIDQQQLTNILKKLGILAPIIYILFYIIGTILLLPSTPLNLTGGAIFGIWWGSLWTSLAAIIAAFVSFYYSRTLGRDFIARKFKGTIAIIDAEMSQGGLFYMFAIRLLPIIPYGIVNFAAGVTSISVRDYLVGTSLGTLPGILPFVMMGSGIKSVTQGDILPLTGALALIGVLIGTATWYKRKRRSPIADLKKIDTTTNNNNQKN